MSCTLDDEIGEGELELMRPQASRVALRREAMALAEEQQDVRRLPDEALAGLEERRRERRTRDRLAVEQCEHARLAATGAGDIDVVGAPASSSASRTNSPRPWIDGQ